MNKMMKSAVMDKISSIKIIEREIPTPQSHEVLVKLEYVGICGSDIHFYEDGCIGDIKATPNIVLGHEPSGTVVLLGDDVKSLQIGDRVAIEPQTTCGKCEFCKSGKYNLCTEVIFFACPPYDGAFSEYVVHDASMCFKLPDNVSTLEGALIEPLAVGLHAANQAEAKLGQTAIVFGTGCIGLVSMMSLKSKGVSKIIMVDVLKNRLNKAKELGADFVINGATEDVVNIVREITNGDLCDLAIETSGNEIAANKSISCVKKGSNIVLVGYSKTGMMNLNITLALDKEVSFRTIFRYRNIYETAIEAVSAGKIDLKSIVSNIYDFDDIKKAMDETAQNKASIVKSVIKMI